MKIEHYLILVGVALMLIGSALDVEEMEISRMIARSAGATLSGYGFGLVLREFIE